LHPASAPETKNPTNRSERPSLTADPRTLSPPIEYQALIIYAWNRKSSMRVSDDNAQPVSASVGVMQAEASDAGCDIETRLALDAERLKGDRFLEAPDQHIGTETHTDCGFGGSAAIGAGERATLHLARCEDRPGHVGFTGDANIDSHTGDAADIDFRATTTGWMEAATDFLGGSENQADAAFDPTVERADLDSAPGRGWSSGGKGGGESDGTCGYDPLFHDRVLFVGSR